MTYPAEILADSPIAYWQLGEASGDFLDSTANARDMTPVPGAGTITREVEGLVADGGNAARLQGGATGSRAHDVPLRLEGSFGIEFWVRVGNATATFPTLFRKGGGTANGSWLVYLNNNFSGLISFKRDNADRNSSTGTVPVGKRTHVGIDYDAAASELRWIVNGAVVLLIPAVTFATGTADTSAVELVSEVGTDHVFDEVALYDHSLTPARWQAHFDAGVKPELVVPRSALEPARIGPY